MRRRWFLAVPSGLAGLSAVLHAKLPRPIWKQRRFWQLHSIMSHEDFENDREFWAKELEAGNIRNVKRWAPHGWEPLRSFEQHFPFEVSSEKGYDVFFLEFLILAKYHEPKLGYSGVDRKNYEALAFGKGSPPPIDMPAELKAFAVGEAMLS